MVKGNGMHVLGLTDYYLGTGMIEFVKACKETGIQSIIGREIDLKDAPVQLLAPSIVG